MKESLKMALILYSMFLIGLLQGREYICGIITVNIVMMMKIIFLSGTMVIKNVSLKKQK